MILRKGQDRAGPTDQIIIIIVVILCQQWLHVRGQGCYVKQPTLSFPDLVDKGDEP
jgi:hypothetical protein